MKTVILILSMLFISFNLSAQEKGNITGTILTPAGKPVELANVIVKETSFGGTTNSDGEFMINNISAGSYTLIISHMGYETIEVKTKVAARETTRIPDVTLTETAKELGVVEVKGSVSNITMSSEYVAKIPLKNIENPQVYNVVTSDLIKEQVITNFDDALKNVPGIDRLWEPTGRGSGDGASYYSLRGFETQATMVNGLPGLTNGSLDPANIERIEVIKGPSGTLFGSSLISYGGLVNTVTKKPYREFGGEVNYISGSFGLNRITADVNIPLSERKDFVLRINTSYHSENSFQDAGFKKSIFIAPSVSYKVNDKLSFLINTEFINAEGTNPVMLFLNRSSLVEYKDLNDLNYNNSLSLTSNDLSIKNPRYNLQAFMNYKLSDVWTSQTVISRGFAESDGYYSYLWDTETTARQFSLYISDQKAKTITTDLQQNFTGDFSLGGLRNRVVIGFDYFNRNITDNSTGYGLVHNVSPQGEINYTDPYTGEELTPYYLSSQSVDALLQHYPRSNSNVRNETYSAYISDVVNITPGLLVMASLRLDYFDNEGDITTEDDNYNQTALSPKFGILYQPILEKLSLFANYQNGFKNVAPSQVSDADGSNPRVKSFEPEHANQLEFGIKTNIFSNRLISTISYYDISVSNVVIQDPQNINNSIQGGEIESKGFEIDINGSPFQGLNITAGFSYNDSKILKGDPDGIWFQEGKRPVSSGPQNLFNFWATYWFSSRILDGFGVGIGAHSASELIVIDSDVTGKFVLPGYTAINSSLFYSFDGFRITLNVNNLNDKEYYKGYSTINPQKPRNYSASIVFKL